MMSQGYAYVLQICSKAKNGTQVSFLPVEV